MRDLRRAAWWSLVAHGVAGLTMLCILQRGLATNPDLADRMEWLDTSRGLWWLGWAPWPFAAVSMLIVGCAYARHVEDGLVGRIVVGLFGIAVTLDLAAESVLIGVLPDMDDVDRFLVMDRIATMLTGCMANGVYTVAACVLAWTMRRQVPAWGSWAAVVVGIGGIWLSAAALLDDVDGLFWSNVVLVPGIMTWLFGLTRLEVDSTP